MIFLRVRCTKQTNVIMKIIFINRETVGNVRRVAEKDPNSSAFAYVFTRRL